MERETRRGVSVELGRLPAGRTDSERDAHQTEPSPANPQCMQRAWSPTAAPSRPAGATRCRLHHYSLYSSIFMIKTKRNTHTHKNQTQPNHLVSNTPLHPRLRCFSLWRSGSVCMDVAAKGWMSPPAPPPPRAVPQFPPLPPDGAGTADLCLMHFARTRREEPCRGPPAPNPPACM